MSWEMRQNVTKKEIKGGQKGKKTCRKCLCAFFLVSDRMCQQLLSFIVPVEAFRSLLYEASMFLGGLLSQNKLYLLIVKHSLKEREKRRWSRVYHVTNTFMSTFLTTTARVAQVLIPSGSKKLMLRTSRTNRTLCTSESGERKAFMWSPWSGLYFRHLGKR